jgi:hypothetical protein
MFKRHNSQFGSFSAVRIAAKRIKTLSSFRVVADANVAFTQSGELVKPLV